MSVRETESGFAYPRSGLWKNGDEYTDLGHVLWFDDLPCVVVGWSDDEIEFAAPIGCGPVMNVSRRNRG